ncbi:MAG: hypothetical protein V1736_07250 [Pseudomonadota bacterium]
MAVSYSIRTGPDPEELYKKLVSWAAEMDVHDSLMKAVAAAAETPPADYIYHQGWVLIAFQNALWQLLHAENLEEGVVDTVIEAAIPTLMPPFVERFWVLYTDSNLFLLNGQVRCCLAVLRPDIQVCAILVPNVSGQWKL